MSVVLIILGIITGTAAALILNKLLADKIENRNHRVGLKAAAYIVCIILGAGFALTCSLQALLDNFIKNRIEFIEIRLAEIFPNSNILETGIDTNEFSSVASELLQLVNDIDTNDNTFFEKLVYETFLNKLTVYVNTVEDGIAAIIMNDDNGFVTIKSILYNLKDIALKTVSPYFVFGQIGIVFLFMVFIGIYIGIVVFLKKGGGMYNKSIVFGDISYDEFKNRRRNTE
jgi:hypothetical protein